MAEHKIKTQNNSSLFYWITRPARKMNNNELRILGSPYKRFAKRLTNKKRRAFLKNDNI